MRPKLQTLQTPRLSGRGVSKREPAAHLPLQHVEFQLPSSCRHAHGMLPITLIELRTLYLHMSKALSPLEPRQVREPDPAR